MKVMCIDNTNGEHNLASLLLKIGEKYTVICENDKGCYYLEEIKFNPKNGNKIAFYKRRFIPISDIDEMELVKERELELVNQ